MIKKNITKLIISLICLLGISAVHAETPKKEGAYKGAKTATHPKWFKESFLDLEEDIADAAENNKRLVVYFWQPGCPYCSQLWEDNFSQQAIVDTFRNNFEIVALNMWGDRELVSVGGNSYSEKSFAEALQIKYTPTLLFFNENKKVIHQLNGYIPPDDFKLSLEYVLGKHEKTKTFGEFSSTKKENKIQTGKLHYEDFFTQGEFNFDRSQKEAGTYLAIFFEEKNCKNCDLLHEKTLTNNTTRKLIRQFQSAQLDRFSTALVTTPDGSIQSVKNWANKLNISYLPAILFFDKRGKEVMRIDAQMRTFHVQSVFDYVLSDAYKTELNFQRYISARADKIREQGIDVDIWAY